MFEQITPDIQVRHDANDICVSSKREVAYVALDGSIWEVSLRTGVQKIIYTFPYQTDCAIACSDDDNLYVRSYHGPQDWVHLSPYKDYESWVAVRYSDVRDLRIPTSVCYSHYPFSRNIVRSTAENFSYVEGNKFNYYDGVKWKQYVLRGSAFFKDMEHVWWVCPDGDSVLFSLIYTPYSSQVWRARGDRAVLLWYGGDREPKYITYSSITKGLYGLSYTVDHLNWKTYYHVSVYQYDIPTLFNLCASIVNREKMIDRVPFCLKDQVMNQETERYLRQKGKKSYDRHYECLTDTQLRELYNNLPI